MKELNIYDKLTIILNHINLVQKNCTKLGFKLIKSGQVEIGRNLISNGQIHDNSKFKGIEFDHLFYDDTLLDKAVKHHQSVNPHHPEYWGLIQHMPDIYLMEMVCDCAARSSEFGTDIYKWFTETATIKYNFKMDDEVGTKISEYLTMLYEKPFK